MIPFFTRFGFFNLGGEKELHTNSGFSSSEAAIDFITLYSIPDFRFPVLFFFLVSEFPYY